MSHQITLISRDGQQLALDCADDQDIISAAEQVGTLLPAMCKSGSCGACLGHCQQGEYTLGSYSDSVLTEAAREQGDILLCRTHPQTDMLIQLPYDYVHIRFGVLSCKPAVISQLQTLAERTVRLVLQLEDKAVAFEPGQCMQLEIPGTDIRRAYSLANISNWQGELEFLIRLQPHGQFSSYLQNNAAVGQTLTVCGPEGAFGLEPNRLNPLLFIAGGTGVAPFISILRRLAEWGEDRDIHLFFGVNQQSELFYQAELQALQQQLPGLAVSVCVWHAEADWQGFTGTPADALQQHLQQQPGDYDIYLCGPPPLVNAATAVALAQGITEAQLFVEKFA